MCSPQTIVGNNISGGEWASPLSGIEALTMQCNNCPMDVLYKWKLGKHIFIYQNERGQRLEDIFWSNDNGNPSSDNDKESDEG